MQETFARLGWPNKCIQNTASNFMVLQEVSWELTAGWKADAVIQALLDFWYGGAPHYFYAGHAKGYGQKK